MVVSDGVIRLLEPLRAALLVQIFAIPELELLLWPLRNAPIAIVGVLNYKLRSLLLTVLVRSLQNFLLAPLLVIITLHAVDVLGGVLADFVQRLLFLESILLLPLEFAKVLGSGDLKRFDQAKAFHSFQLLEDLAWIALLPDDLRHALD